VQPALLLLLLLLLHQHCLDLLPTFHAPSSRLQVHGNEWG
jgi:hypothetical protein